MVRWKITQSGKGQNVPMTEIINSLKSELAELSKWKKINNETKTQETKRLGSVINPTF